LTNKTKIALVFWAHFAVALASHVFVILMIGGVLKLLLAASALSFWERGLMLGITFYTAMYACNHISNKDGFCVLTDLENHYRAADNTIKVGSFCPRFYSKLSDISKSVSNLFKRGMRRE